MICKQCGNELKDGALFCTNCGAKQVPDENERAIASDDEKTVGIFANAEKLITFNASIPVALPITVKIVARRYPETIPIIKGIILSIFLPYTEEIIVTKRVTRPHNNAMYGEVTTSDPVSSTMVITPSTSLMT